MKSSRKSDVNTDGEIPAKDLDQDLAQIFRNLGLVAFGAPASGRKLENHDAVWVVHTFASASTDETTTHALGRVPVGMIPVELPGLDVDHPPAFGSIIFGSRLPTSSLITLQCATAGKRAALIIF